MIQIFCDDKFAPLLIVFWYDSDRTWLRHANLSSDWYVNLSLRGERARTPTCKTFYDVTGTDVRRSACLEWNTHTPLLYRHWISYWGFIAWVIELDFDSGAFKLVFEAPWWFSYEWKYRYVGIVHNIFWI